MKKNMWAIAFICAYAITTTGTAYAITDAATYYDGATEQAKLEEKLRLEAEYKVLEAKKLEEKMRLKAEQAVIEAKKLEEKLRLKGEQAVLEAKKLEEKKRLEQSGLDAKTLKEKAQTLTDEAKRKAEAAKQEVEKMRAEALEKAKLASTTRAEFKEMRDDLKEQVFRKFGRQLDEVRISILYRYEMAVKSLENLVSRIQTRIEKLEAEAKDVSGAKEKLSVAQNALTKANTDVNALAALLKQDASDANREELFKTVREQGNIAKASVQDAHKAVRATIVEIIKIK